MKTWLIISFMGVSMLCCIQKIGQHFSHAGKHFLFCLRHQSVLAQIGIFCLWGIFLPFFAIWTVLGSKWFYTALQGSPNCIYEDTHAWLIIFWQLLAYIVVLSYTSYFGIACAVEHRLRAADANARRVETEDSVSRWGRMSSRDGWGSESFVTVAESALKPQMGLKPADIQAIPCLDVESVIGLMDTETHCPIC